MGTCFLYTFTAGERDAHFTLPLFPVFVNPPNVMRNYLMTKTKVLFLGLILFFCFAKAQSQNVDVDALNSDLISTWTWFKTIHNYESSGPIPDDTPILCKCNRRIVFRNNFQVEQYSNDTLVSTESYSIEKVRYNESDRAILRSKLVNGQIS